MKTALRRWRFWLDYHRDELGAVRAIAGYLLLIVPAIGVVVWLAYPTGPSRTVEGEVLALGFRETDLGAVPSASIKIGDRSVRIDLPLKYGCKAGDRIALKRRPSRFGFAYGVGTNPRPCSR